MPLYLVGVGYRVAYEKASGDKTLDQLVMKLGYSHTVYVDIPAHIKAEVPSPTKIVLSCTDKHLLGLFAAQVRAWRKPEVYKGKVRCPFSRLFISSDWFSREFSLAMRSFA